MNSEIALNGELPAMHPYGYTPFLADLTPALRLVESDSGLAGSCMVKALTTSP